jgi:hypothetical protein
VDIDEGHDYQYCGNKDNPCETIAGGIQASPKGTSATTEIYVISRERRYVDYQVILETRDLLLVGENKEGSNEFVINEYYSEEKNDTLLCSFSLTVKCHLKFTWFVFVYNQDILKFGSDYQSFFVTNNPSSFLEVDICKFKSEKEFGKPFVLLFQGRVIISNSEVTNIIISDSSLFHYDDGSSSITSFILRKVTFSGIEDTTDYSSNDGSSDVDPKGLILSAMHNYTGCEECHTSFNLVIEDSNINNISSPGGIKYGLFYIYNRNEDSKIVLNKITVEFSNTLDDLSYKAVSGGIVYIEGLLCSMEISQSVFENSLVDFNGGALCFNFSEMLIIGTECSNFDSLIVINDTTFRNCNSTEESGGGAIYTNVVINLLYCSFVNNYETDIYYFRVIDTGCDFDADTNVIDSCSYSIPTNIPFKTNSEDK